MANLITEKQKRAIKLEYLVRLFSVSLLIISLLGIFLLAYVIPYYISVSKKDLKTAEQFEAVINVENKENVGESVWRTVNQTTDELTAVELSQVDNLTPSVYFSKIIASKNSNIYLTKLSFSLIKKGQGQFLVSGLAKNRNGLVAFIEALKTKAGFASVESPVSDFAKDHDISFTLNIN